ncbi:MAG: diguanylate cyclase [Candidatus Cloacimonadaceae bacterium]|nr:diguanylate cyclase [Candidatus Cloacimonadaceae bacterium]MDP3114725.1 diguanylate cyclase [Candidatus Cloacimonadaceae bacterium]
MKELNVQHIYSTVFKSAVVAIGITDLDANYILVNPAWCEFTGYSAKEAMSMNVGQLTLPDETEKSRQMYRQLLSVDNSGIRKARRYLRKDGRVFWADLHVSALADDEGKVIGVIGIFVDIDRRVEAENHLKELNRELTKLARHDSLTGLYNRRVMEDICLREGKRASRYKRGLAIAIVDIDNFKHVNDTYGHECGDIVLKRVADIFLSSIRETDTAGRWGGEEFLLVFSETSCEGAEIVAERIRSRVESEQFICRDHQLSITVTIGFSYHRETLQSADLINEADLALYSGKNNGKNKVVCFQGDCLNT